jgi:hypothetical protein
MVSCSKYFDAAVYNPCAHPTTVSFWSGSAVPANDNQWHPTVTISPVSVGFANGVFGHPDSIDTGFVRIQMSGRPVRILRVTIKSQEPVQVLIPATYC